MSEMREYQKINSVFKRDEKGQLIDGDWACPEFGYLAELDWRWTEKVDGTNVRVYLYHTDQNAPVVQFGGRTDNAQMPTFLYDRLADIFTASDLEAAFPDSQSATLYGEGYGRKVQKGAGNYNPEGCDFILFDVRVGDWWLQPEDVADVAEKLGLRTVPVIGTFTLNEAIAKVRCKRVQSAWENVRIEGIVGTPTVPLFNRKGERIIVKVKGRDFPPTPEASDKGGVK